MDNKALFIQNVFNDIICNPIHDENKISLYFSNKYEQRVDGKILNYEQFVEHLSFLKEHTKNIHYSLLSIASNEDTVFTHHYIKAEKKDGTQSEFEILARFTLSLGKIIACHELTRLVSGNQEDSNLGSKK